MGKQAILVAAILTMWTGTVLAQSMSAPGGTTPVLASTLAPAEGGATLVVTSSAFKNGGVFPNVYTQNGQNISPPLSWSRGPAGTKSYVVLTEDSGVSRPQPIFHWVLYDVPAGTTHLPQALPTEPKLAAPAGARNGLNIRKASGYMGPKPPAGQTHPYHFEVFALDKTLDLDPATADRNAVVAAMKGHVLAEGEIVGMYTGK
ncbi:MAG: YbhB/YbcL family Raf kinase inhibitor-like protein [Rhizomicrobium sp.]